MATSSITHNFIITDPKVAERLAKALEESANDPPRPFTVSVRHLREPDELKEFMERVKRANAEEGNGKEE